MAGHLEAFKAHYLLDVRADPLHLWNHLIQLFDQPSNLKFPFPPNIACIKQNEITEILFVNKCNFTLQSQLVAALAGSARIERLFFWHFCLLLIAWLAGSEFNLAFCEAKL